MAEAGACSVSKADQWRRFMDMKIAQGRFVIKSRIGGGSFGEIFAGIDVWANKDIAIKLEQVKARHPQLNYESKVYKLLHQSSLSVVGIPEVHYFGQEGDFNVMVVDLCGPSLEDLFNYCGRKFSIKTIAMLADQFLHRLEFVHSKHMIHRDIKPENFVMGTGDKGHHVYLIDFGLSKKYWDSRTNQHIPYKEGKPLTGTARYCSINTHLGFEQSRRDDLESIGYLLIYFAKGFLPWQGIRVPDPDQKTARIGEKKFAIGVDYLCRDEPVAFMKFLKYARALKFEEVPDYDWCRSLFSEMLDRENLARDWIFDWVVKRQHEIEHETASQRETSTSSGNKSMKGESSTTSDSKLPGLVKSTPVNTSQP